MCDKGTYDRRLIYPEVQPPSEPYNSRREQYSEVPAHERTSTASSFLTEEDSPHMHHSSQGNYGIVEETSNVHTSDLFLEKL